MFVSQQWALQNLSMCSTVHYPEGPLLIKDSNPRKNCVLMHSLSHVFLISSSKIASFGLWFSIMMKHDEEECLLNVKCLRSSVNIELFLVQLDIVKLGSQIHFLHINMR